MAETLAIELTSVIIQKLADEAFKRIARSQGIQTELKELGRTLTKIQDLLNDASEQEVSKQSVKDWLTSYQHLAYDISDVLDDLATDAMHRELSPESVASTSKVRKLIPSCCTNFSITHRLSAKLDSINKELELLEKQNPGLIVIGEKPKNTSRRNETSVLDRSKIVGREVEVDKLVKKLLSDQESSEENFSIVPIVGMGGVGKTTLARLLYNETRLENHFIIKVWFCVSDDFNIFKISDAILQDVTKENKEFKDLNQLQKALTEQFKDKRFLLVLDDLWHEKYEDWEKLVRPFHSCAPGSRIIITTRKDQLLLKLGFDHPDRLETLSPEGALSLVAFHALGVDNFDSHTIFKPYGEGIVKKCEGLPLAIKAIGRLLRSKGTRVDVKDWDDVLNSEIWDIEDGENIIPALRLSYYELSAELKQLFVYCSLFPKDYMFKKEELVLLWMAEGFLNPSSATKLPERLGHEYFEDLLSRSFFQHAPNDESLFMMHDLMVDLATFVAREFFLRFDNHMDIEKKDLVKHRHMSFVREEYVGYGTLEAFKGAKSLRTFLATCVGVDVDSWRDFYLSSKILVELLPELALLRVLSLSHFKITEVPECIGNLKHLRYLNLSKTDIKEVPENVGNLYNLETLILFGCENLTKLPKSFIKLKKLRHFDIRDTWNLTKLPLGIGELKSLHTLTRIIIEGDDGFAINELKQLKNLHGEISIEGLHKVQSAKHTQDANLSLKGITKLGLKWVDVFDGSRSDTLEKEVMDELKPNIGTLKELEIVSYGGSKFPSWVGDPSFHELVKVSICGCRKCISLPPFGQLPSLKELSVSSMNKVKSIGLESVVGVFPSLETLSFEDMPSWEEWSADSKEVFPCLQKLLVENCPKLFHISLEALPSLRELIIESCGDGVLTSVVQATSSITHLKIESILGLTDEVWRVVIKYLRAVEEVHIYKCNEIRYLWESEGKASKDLVNLKNLDLWSCDNLVSLGEKEDEEDGNIGSNHLESLKYLSIGGCKSIDRICCPNSNNIEDLTVVDCESLTRVFFPTTIGGAREEGGKKLKSLLIGEGKKLTENINNANMPMLEEISLMGWTSLKSITQLSTTFNHLTSLGIIDCPSIESLPELSTLTLLKELYIRECRSMSSSFPCGVTWPPKMVKLQIGRLQKPMLEWGHQNFPTSLVHLQLFGEKDVVSDFSQLSDFLPSSLTKLEIIEFGKLKSLSRGLQHLTSLQHLRIWNCLKMKHLPVTLLPSLLSLNIYGCPKLEKRCSGRGSHYWPLISHIPRISAPTDEEVAKTDEQLLEMFRTWNIVGVDFYLASPVRNLMNGLKSPVQNGIFIPIEDTKTLSMWRLMILVSSTIY